MYGNSSDAATDSEQQAAHGEQPATHRNHSLQRAIAPQCTGCADDGPAARVFPTRVDSSHAQRFSAVESGAFFERKYLLDRCIGFVLLVLFSPVILALYLVVRATSRGPGFYKQERVGLNGKPFEIFKLRSMVQNAEKPGQPQWATKGDSRVNFVGRVLRKLHLDELPQLYNVCRGEMSLVGPRPERPQICEDLAQQISGYYLRTAVKPGVTGLAQINLPPDESIEDVRRKQILDLNYIDNANLWLDVRMIAATALRMVGVKGHIVTKLMRLDRTHLVKDVCSTQDSQHASSIRQVRPAVRAEAMVDSRSSVSPAVAFSLAAGSDDSSYTSFPNRPR
tara:strand:+ start:74 stop:1084 length:1011 start_codon:yes stop_codon:yes gene_type:complete